jgi:hypothetical protein
MFDAYIVAFHIHHNLSSRPCDADVSIIDVGALASSYLQEQEGGPMSGQPLSKGPSTIQGSPSLWNVVFAGGSRCACMHACVCACNQDCECVNVHACISRGLGEM